MTFARSWKSAIGLIGVLGIWGVMLMLYWPYTVDDAYIIFRYARNWSRGLGLVYNPGVPVDGYTSFLWTILLGIGFRLGIPLEPDTVAKIWGLVFGSFTLFLVWRLPNFTGQSSPTRWIAVTFTAVAPSIVISSVDGLETPLYLVLQMALLVHWLRDIREGRLSLASGLLAGLLTLARPDGILLMPLLLLLFLWFRRPSQWATVWRTGLPFIIGWCFIYFPYFFWHWAYYGSPFPNTFYAKPGGHPDQILSGALRISANLQEIGGWATLIPVVLAFTEGLSPYNAVLVGTMFSRIVFHLWSGGEVMGHHRFLAPALPAYFLLFQHGLDTLESMLLSKDARWPRYAILLMPVLLSAYIAMAPLLDLRPALLQYAQGLEQAHIRLGRWLDRHTAPTARIAIGDAGAVPYYADRYTIDLMALNDAYLARLPARFGHKIDVIYVLSQQPDYVILLSGSSPQHGFRGLTPVDQAIYEAIAANPRYVLQDSYKFGETYFLWVFARK